MSWLHSSVSTLTRIHLVYSLDRRGRPAEEHSNKTLRVRVAVDHPAADHRLHDEYAEHREEHELCERDREHRAQRQPPQRARDAQPRERRAEQHEREWDRDRAQEGRCGVAVST
jgi:hypothetical protein